MYAVHIPKFWRAFGIIKANIINGKIRYISHFHAENYGINNGYILESKINYPAKPKTKIKDGSITFENVNFSYVKDKKKLADELGIGEITLTDILKELEKPARDPREDMPAPILRSDVLDMKDLKPDMILKGTVRNVIDFGVFVDIGVHQDGLVHISQITDKFIKHPLEAVSVGDVVDVKVLEVDIAKKRISLTMRLGNDSKKTN